MLHPRVMLLVVTALAHYGAKAHTNHQSPTRLVTPEWHDIPTTRFLTVHGLTADDEEERGVTLSAVEMLRNALKSMVPESQLEIWFKHAASADDVFKRLLVDNAADDLLNAWLQYMKQVHNTYSTMKKTSLIATLTIHYGDEGMAKIIEAAKQVPSTERIAKRLESELTQLWLGQKHTVDDVFKLLKLDEAGEQLFAQPQVVAWVKYMDDFNEANPDNQVSLFSFVSALHPKDETLVNMLIAAKKSIITENIAVRIQAEQSKKWMTDKKSPTEIFSLLNLKDEGKALFTSPLFQSWLKYTDEFNMLNSKEKVAAITILRTHYSDDVLAKMIITADKTPSTQNFARRLRSELQREWYETLKPGDVVFKLLKLDKTGPKVFERPLFDLWKEYMAFVSLKDPRIKVSFIIPLVKVYGERKLAKLLATAEEVPSTKTFAETLREALFKRWRDDKKTLEMISSLLRIDEAAPDDPIRTLYNKFIVAFNGQ